MANTYTQIYIHLVFSPYARENIIPVKHKEELQKYTTGIIQNRKHKLLAINYMSDHVHILIGYSPAQSLSDLVRDIKSNTSNFINSKKWVPGKFRWQEGYGAFSHSYRQLDVVVRYIDNQEKHHSKSIFKDEYIAMLEKYKVDYKEDYLFDWK